ncbi:MAG TPA: alpha/beta hydrolase [Kofleriaceae bacterium]|jgi:pimeloyl-ACP methyl ester carboxylesterase|nr:alpha/beta hydrolase [Kofleriaceae bacterium]
MHACLLALAVCGCASRAQVDTATSATSHHFQPTAFSVEVRGGSGRPVILIPGLGCPASVWRDTAAHLHRLGYQTHALTLAGFAGKPRIDRPLARTTVEELARYIRDRHLVSPVIVGHSLGGTLAYWLAAREPALVGAIIIVDAGASASEQAAAAQIRDTWRDASDAQFSGLIRDMFRSMSVKPERLAPVAAEVERSDRRAIGDVIYELSADPVRDKLSRIRAPVLVVLASGALQDEFRREARDVRDHEVVVVPGTGHFVMLDDPPAFNAVLDDFLIKHPRGGLQARRLDR